MPEPTVTPLRTRAAAGYTDTAALNDIHTILTADPGEEALADIAQVLTRAGRPLVAVRDIEITTTETALGWPAVCARAGDISVLIRQAPASTALLIEITTTSAVEHDAVTIVLDGGILHPAHPDGSDAA